MQAHPQEEEFEEIEVLYVRAQDVERIVFTAEPKQSGNDRSLIESTELLNSVEGLPLEQHISASQWLSSVHNEVESDSEDSDSSAFGYSSSECSDSEGDTSALSLENISDQQMIEEDIDENIFHEIGIQTYLRSLHWDGQTFNSLQRTDHFQYFPKEEFSADLFFEVFSARQKKGSSSSMTQLSLLNDKELFDTLQGLSDNLKAKKKKLVQNYQKEFPLWHFQLKEGFNVLLYGLGSKKKLMDDLMKEELSADYCVIVKGYFPALSLKNLLGMIYSSILNYLDVPADPIYLCNLIREHYMDTKEKHKPPVYLLIYSIDGIALRNKKAQTILSLLACIPEIHIIASVDHIKSAYLWDYYISGNFNFISHHVCTYENYENETKYETNPFISKASKGTLGIRAALMVLEGLPTRAHQVFSLLAEEQLQSNSGFSFKLLLRKCREKFILTSEHHLKGYMNEFKEHKLIKIVNNRKEGTELYSISMPSAYISKIVAEIENGALGNRE